MEVRFSKKTTEQSCKKNIIYLKSIENISDENNEKSYFEKNEVKNQRTRNDWNYDEETKLLSFIEKYGTLSWKKCSKYVGTRTKKQCKEKWNTSINPKIKKGFWSRQEQLLIFNMMKNGKLSWIKIQKKMPHRTNVTIRNFVFNSFKKIKNSKFFDLLKKILNRKTPGRIELE